MRGALRRNGSRAHLWQMSSTYHAIDQTEQRTRAHQPQGPPSRLFGSGPFICWERPFRLLTALLPGRLTYKSQVGPHLVVCWKAFSCVEAASIGAISPAEGSGPSAHCLSSFASLVAFKPRSTECYASTCGKLHSWERPLFLVGAEACHWPSLPLSYPATRVAKVAVPKGKVGGPLVPKAKVAVPKVACHFPSRPLGGPKWPFSPQPCNSLSGRCIEEFRFTFFWSFAIAHVRHCYSEWNVGCLMTNLFHGGTCFMENHVLLYMYKIHGLYMFDDEPVPWRNMGCCMLRPTPV